MTRTRTVTYRAFLFVGSIIAVCAAPGMASPQTRCPHGSPTGVSAKEVAFARGIQQAVERNDRNWLADHTHYPLHYSVGIRSKTQFIKTRAAFLEKFDTLFIYNVTFAIRHTDLHCLFKENNHVMMGDGEVWFGSFSVRGNPGGKALLVSSILTADQGR